MKQLATRLVFLSLALCLAVAPAALAEPGQPAAEAPAVSPALLFADSVPGTCNLARDRGEIPDPSAQATCSAQCSDTGGSVSVTCSGGCSAKDQDCDAGIRGYAKCDDGSQYNRCGECPCSAYTLCPDGTELYCEGSDGDCLGGPGLCFVRCNGQYQFCPGHFGEIQC